MKSYLLRIWRSLPVWIHFLGAKVVRSKFRVAVAAMIFDEKGRILLFEHTYRKFQWGIPAGSLEYDEQPARAVVREFLEETGMHIRVERLLAAVSAREGHHVSLIYLCRITGGDFRPSDEISDMRYFEPADLPKMLTTERELIGRVVSVLHEKESRNQ